MKTIRFRGIGAAAACGLIACVCLLAGYILLVFFYVINTWSDGVGLSAAFFGLSVAYTILLIRSGSDHRGRGTGTKYKALMVILVAVSGLGLVANKSLDGFGVLLPPLAASALYGTLIGMQRRKAVRGFPSLAAAIVPLAAAALSALLAVWDPLGAYELLDGFLLALPTTGACGAALWVLSRKGRRMSSRPAQSNGSENVTM